MGDTDLVALRELVGAVTSSILDMHTHETLAEACELLGLPAPPDEGAKRQRVSKSFAALPDAQLPEVAKRILDHQALDAETRNAIQDVLWAGEDPPQIPKRTRREIAREFNLEDLIYSTDRFGWPRRRR